MPKFTPRNSEKTRENLNTLIRFAAPQDAARHQPLLTFWTSEGSNESSGPTKGRELSYCKISRGAPLQKIRLIFSRKTNAVIWFSITKQL